LGRVDALLKVRDETEIRARGLSDACKQELRDVIARHQGAELLSMDNPTTTLEELFLTIVRDSEARPGRRAHAEPTEAAKS
jgi:ABC-2 type transport system ATP-binding protein